ncbi:MAG: Eco29kI family restriction endonuclease [Robiginitomaculum sp.]|nr:Eco29kI family restriction endonuclease [Robiginitomaculum sp.]
MKNSPFDREKHIYENDAFDELVKDAVRFFNGTPVLPVPPQERFSGVGVYALYYIGSAKPYTRYGQLNRIKYEFPIYVGKAVPRGWRQARVTASVDTETFELIGRVREHSITINKGKHLDVNDFMCRFVIFEGVSSSMIGTVESALIRLFRPLWNTEVDGFGNHDPGKGRYNQAKSDWDVLHPGREWADRCAPNKTSLLSLSKRISDHLELLK